MVGFSFESRNSGTNLAPCLSLRSNKLVYAETAKLALVKIPYKDDNFYTLILSPRGEENIGECLRLSQVEGSNSSTTSARSRDWTLHVAFGPFIVSVTATAGLRSLKK